MITYFFKSDNNFDKEIEKCKNNINEIYNISDLLKITNIEISDAIKEDSYDTLKSIFYYDQTYKINNYSLFVCPCCKKENTLAYHKCYERNLVFTISNYIIYAKINLIVLECSNCKNKSNKQHYHTLFPEVIFPYHIFSEEIILNSISDKEINNIKIKEIENKYKITYQLLYYWLKIMDKYKLASSVILKISHEDMYSILIKIINNKISFLSNFYQKYYHPFFLIKRTCVELAITP